MGDDEDDDDVEDIPTNPLEPDVELGGGTGTISPSVSDASSNLIIDEDRDVEAPGVVEEVEAVVEEVQVVVEAPVGVEGVEAVVEEVQAVVEVPAVVEVCMINFINITF